MSIFTDFDLDIQKTTIGNNMSLNHNFTTIFLSPFNDNDPSSSSIVSVGGCTTGGGGGNLSGVGGGHEPVKCDV